MMCGVAEALTVMCQAAGKLLSTYQRAYSPQEFLRVLSADVQICTSDLLIVRKVGKPQEQGTWIHPDAAVHFGH